MKIPLKFEGIFLFKFGSLDYFTYFCIVIKIVTEARPKGRLIGGNLSFFLYKIILK
jgi:hypothetical protein